jgi:hypothetical protein
MTSSEFTITQYDDPHNYCRFWDDSGSAFVNNDLPSVSISGSSFVLWAQPLDKLYVGKSSTFAYVGFRMAAATIGTYGTFSLFYSITSADYTIATVTPDHTITVAADIATLFTDGRKFTITGSTANDGEYTCDGNATYSAPDTTITVVETLPDGTDDGTIAAHSIWAPLTAYFNNTEGFTQHGYVAWSIPGDWGLSSVNSESGYWIRAEQDGTPGSAVEAHHLRRNLTLNPPIHADGPSFTRARTYADINGNVQKKDLTYAGPDKLTLMITQMACSMGNLQLLLDWEYYRNDLYLEDGANSSVVNFPAVAAYYRIMQGKIALGGVPLEMRSPGKMGLGRGESYPLVFDIDTVVTQSSLLGLSL